MENRFLNVTQIGIVVRDLNKAIESFKKIFQAEPDSYGETPLDGRKFHGKEAEFSCKMAFYNFANVQFELVQPDEHESIWNEFLDSGKEGLHHIRFSIDDFEGTVAYMKKCGIEMAMEGKSVRGPGYRWGYFDSEKEIGFPMEIFNEYEKF